MDKNNKPKKAWYKSVWVWVGVIVVVAIIGSTSAPKSQQAATDNQTPAASTEVPKEETSTPEAKKPDVPAEYTSALSQATSYANNMHMSKQGVYDQLTSQYGGQFSAKAAQYAIDNVKADWKANALVKAKDYQKQQSLSPAAIHDQLTSSYGEKFTNAEADYAIAHLND